MSTLKIKIANFFAKNSCSAWQSVRLIRRISRGIYRIIMENGAMTYPYENPEFANWPESDEKGKYSLITDSSNFVIRRSPSYCAWMAAKTTGWLRRPIPGKRAPGEHDFDAKHWDELLEYNGWERRELGPKLFDAINGTHFIGVIADEGEFGQVVWLEGYTMFYDPTTELVWLGGVTVSTYDNFYKIVRSILLSERSDIVWYAEPDAKKLPEGFYP